jgi:hypothetical protein
MHRRAAAEIEHSTLPWNAFSLEEMHQELQHQVFVGRDRGVILPKVELGIQVFPTRIDGRSVGRHRGRREVYRLNNERDVR